MGSAESAATRPETETTFSLCLELIRIQISKYFFIAQNKKNL